MVESLVPPLRRLAPQHVRRALQTLWFIFLCVLLALLLVMAPHDNAEARGRGGPALATATATATASASATVTPEPPTCFKLPRRGTVICVRGEQAQDVQAGAIAVQHDIGADSTASTATATTTAITGTCIPLPRRPGCIWVQSP